MFFFLDACSLLTLQRSRRGRRVCSWARHRGRCGWWLPADSADTQSAPARSGTFPPAVRSQWLLLLEERGRSLCDLPCGQSDWDQDPSVLASHGGSDRVEGGSGHLYRRKLHLLRCIRSQVRHTSTCTDVVALMIVFFSPTDLHVFITKSCEWKKCRSLNFSAIFCLAACSLFSNKAGFFVVKKNIIIIIIIIRGRKHKEHVLCALCVGSNIWCRSVCRLINAAASQVNIPTAGGVSAVTPDALVNSPAYI